MVSCIFLVCVRVKLFSGFICKPEIFQSRVKFSQQVSPLHCRRKLLYHLHTPTHLQNTHFLISLLLMFDQFYGKEVPILC